MTIGETMPAVLFHGTPLPGLTKLHPAPGGVLYASDDMRLSSTFLADPEHCVCVRSSRGHVQAFIGEPREEFLRRDRGGTIYLLDARRFSPAPPDVSLRRVWEWTTVDEIEPMGSIVYVSALTAMIALGVRVYFVSREFCENFRSPGDAAGRYHCENDRFERYLRAVEASPAARGTGVGYAATCK
jgi:hypothetical protein